MFATVNVMYMSFFYAILHRVMMEYKKLYKSILNHKHALKKNKIFGVNLVS